MIPESAAGSKRSDNNKLAARAVSRKNFAADAECSAILYSCRGCHESESQSEKAKRRLPFGLEVTMSCRIQRLVGTFVPPGRDVD
jgi:hypothetical protein